MLSGSSLLTVVIITATSLMNVRGAALVDTTRERTQAWRMVDSLYREYAKKNVVPGVAYGVVLDGKLVYANGIGFADVEKKVPVTPASVYRIASMTKSFTAMAILRLRDAKKLSLDDPVSRFIPEISNTKPLTPDSPPITIRHLLTHTAGFPEDNPWGDRQLQRTDKELIDFIAKGISLSSVPGQNYEYSNLGFAMLGHIVTVASGMSFEKYISENILRPLGMTHTYWEFSDVPADQLVNGYRLVNGSWVREALLHSGAYGAMGGMLTSIDDFAKYIAFHMSSYPAGDTAAGPVSKATLREMHGPGKVVYINEAQSDCPRIGSYNDGLGYSKDCKGIEMIGHSGGLPGFGTHWTFLPQYRIGIVSFCNLTYEAAGGLDSRIIRALVTKLSLREAPIVPSKILEQRKQQIVALLPKWDGAQQAGIFSENFFSDYFIDSLRAQSARLFTQAGRITSITPMMPENQLRGRFVITGDHSDIEVGFTLSPENPALVQELEMRESQKVDSTYLRYGLKTINSMEVYRRSVTEDSNQALIELKSLMPGIALDIHYARSDNLMKRPVYPMAAAYLRRPAALALKGVEADLRPMGLGLKIFDGYRPYSVTVQFYEKFLDSVFVASPYTGSRHNRGCAVDVTLIVLKTGKELKMPTPYDSFTKEAAPDYPLTDKVVLKNRTVLQQVMLRHGFELYPSEWWHFDFAQWRNYPVMDLSFESLNAQQ